LTIRQDRALGFVSLMHPLLVNLSQQTHMSNSALEFKSHKGIDCLLDIDCLHTLALNKPIPNDMFMMIYWTVGAKAALHRLSYLAPIIDATCTGTLIMLSYLFSCQPLQSSPYIYLS
jgi:hypothetical protein